VDWIHLDIADLPHSNMRTLVAGTTEFLRACSLRAIYRGIYKTRYRGWYNRVDYKTKKRGYEKFAVGEGFSSTQKNKTDNFSLSKYKL
jgi:hypothetical protein